MALGKPFDGTTVRSVRRPCLRNVTRRGSGDWSRSTLSVVIHWPSKLAQMRLPCREMNCGAFTKWKHVCEFNSRSISLPVLRKVWRYHRHALGGSGVNVDVTVNWSNSRFVVQWPRTSCSNSWCALSHQFPQTTFPDKYTVSGSHSPNSLPGQPATSIASNVQPFSRCRSYFRSNARMRKRSRWIPGPLDVVDA